MAVAVIITPVLQKVEKQQFQENGGCLFNVINTNFSFSFNLVNQAFL